jgi:lysine-specific histone demethylase 1
MSCVVDSLAQGLDIRLSCPVKKVAYSSAGVRVESKLGKSAALAWEVRARARGGSGGAGLTGTQADVCLVTVPLGVLKSPSIEFLPALPALKRRAIGNLGFGVLDKVALLFPEKFWGRKNGEMFGWCSSDRGDMPIFVDMSHDGHPVLCALISGSPAERMEAVASDDKVAERALRALRKIFGSHAVPKPLEVCVTRWRADPYARGSYSFVQVGSDVSGCRGGRAACES